MELNDSKSHAIKLHLEVRLIHLFKNSSWKYFSDKNKTICYIIRPEKLRFRSNIPTMTVSTARVEAHHLLTYFHTCKAEKDRQQTLH